MILFIYETLRKGFIKDFLVSSYANALDDKHFSSNASDAIRGEAKRNTAKMKAREASTRFFMISVPKARYLFHL